MTNAALSQITTRVVKLETESATATGFTIDLDERRYLVTSNLAACVTEIVRKGAEG
jgi:hypothetical protein